MFRNINGVKIYICISVNYVGWYLVSVVHKHIFLLEYYIKGWRQLLRKTAAPFKTVQ